MKDAILSTLRRILVIVADRFFLLRPLVIVPAVTFFLLGYDQADRVNNRGEGKLGLAVISYALLMGSIYIVNQLADIESDRANEKLFLLPRKIIGKNEARIFASVLAVLSMIGAAKIGVATVSLFCLSLFIGILYSLPPFALKRFFPFDILSNAIGYGIVAYAAGWSVLRAPGLHDVVHAVPFAFCVAGVFVLTALADREGDRNSGYRSTGVALTKRQGVLLALVLLLLALPVAIPTRNWIATAGVVASLPFFAYAVLREDYSSVTIAYRCSSAIFILIVGAVQPVFLCVVLVLLGLSRVYYSKRFSLDYPSVRGR